MHLKAFVTDKAFKLFEKYEVLSHKETTFPLRYLCRDLRETDQYRSADGNRYGQEAVYARGIEYATFLADSIGSFNSVSVSAPVQEDLLKKLGSLLASSYKNLTKLEAAVAKTQAIADTVKKAESYRDKVVTAMQALRSDIDALEMIVPKDMWPVPNYTDLLFKL